MDILITLLIYILVFSLVYYVACRHYGIYGNTAGNDKHCTWQSCWASF